jgi:hypothetical protein
MKCGNTNYELNSFLNILQASFPIHDKTRLDYTRNRNISQTQKESAYVYSRNSNNPRMRAYYIKYCKILNTLINEAKRQHYSRLTAKLDNQIKTWNIIKHKTGKLHLTEQIPSLLKNDEEVKDPEVIADAFNTFFSDN